MHTIGNLTLVTQSLNSAASNAAWAIKRNTLDNYSVLSLKQSFKALPPRDEDAITEHGKMLFKVALKVRPRPA